MEHPSENTSAQSSETIMLSELVMELMFLLESEGDMPCFKRCSPNRLRPIRRPIRSRWKSSDGKIVPASPSKHSKKCVRF